MPRVDDVGGDVDDPLRIPVPVVATFQSQLMTPNSLPGIRGSPGHQVVHALPPGQLPPL
jgi:hypothetical protein